MKLELLFKSKLTKSEIGSRHVRISRRFVENFPKGNFEITIGGITLTKKIDKYFRIYLNVKDYTKPGDIIEFYKNQDGSYHVIFIPT